MTVLHTLKKRTTDVTSSFKSALDKLAEQVDSLTAIIFTAASLNKPKILLRQD